MIVLNIGVFIMCLAGTFLAGYIMGKRNKKQHGTTNVTSANSDRPYK